MEHQTLASVRSDLRAEGLEIAVAIVDDIYEWATFTRRPARVHSAVDSLYQVLLEDGRVVIADSIDLEFEEVPTTTKEN